MLYVERLGYEFGTVLVTFVGISYFTSQFALILPGTNSSSQKKKLTKFVDISSIIASYLKMSKYHTSFYDKFMFSKDWLKCHLKRCKQFFEENMNLSKKRVCCFASLVLCIFLKQPCMNVRYFVNCMLF